PTSAAVNISGWKVQYRSAAGAGYTVAIATVGTGVTLAAHGFYLLTGAAYSLAASVPGDQAFTNGLAAAGGHLRIGPPAMGTALVDTNVVDTVGWGTAAGPEGGMAAPAPTTTGSAERKA